MNPATNQLQLRTAVPAAVPAARDEIVVYQPDETIRLDVRVENESIWLTQARIAELFGVQKAAISKHLKNIFAWGELREEATVSKMETVQTEGTRPVPLRLLPTPDSRFRHPVETPLTPPRPVRRSSPRKSPPREREPR